ncbi:MAG: DUF3667 domain-containing protein [Flavobacteriales bacterium]|nr:DUF3667 domain-containing protein [Flavobacteriales bacterium]NNK79929.1 DUF3667 domain-containing protein [Flavobacteriales bacterium]
MATKAYFHLTEMTSEIKDRCRNCACPSEGNYCLQCGQKSNIKRISFKEIGEQVSSTVFNLEAPFYRTFKGLIIRPGDLIQDFLRGKRKAYYKPVPYYILAVAIHLLLGYLIGYDPIQAVIDSTGGENQMSEVERKASYWMARNVNYILPVWILIISLMDRLFFWRSGTNLAERVTVYLFLTGQYVFLNTLLIPLIKLQPYFQMVDYLVVFSYMTYAILKFHGGGWWAGLRAFLLAFLSFVLYVVLMNVVLITWFSYF